LGYERGLSAIYLEDTDRVAQIEYISHTGLIRRVSGMNPFEAPAYALAKTYERLDIDMVFYTRQSYTPYAVARGQGTAQFVETESWSKLFPSTWRTTFPVKSVEDVLGYEPIAEVGERSFDEIVDFFREEHSLTQRRFKTQLIPGGHYCTIFMWFVMTFGLEWTLRAAGHDPKRFEKLLNKFGEASMRDFRAWAQCDIKAFISHDDICMTEGPLFSPNWLRKHIFPWYKKLWKVLKDKGIRIIFCSDGDITPIVDDIADAGADGFILEPWCDLDYIAKKYGNSKVIMGNVDLKILTFKGREEAIREAKRCLSTAGHHPGYFINVTGSIPDNVPLENLEAYFKACRKYGRRPLTELWTCSTLRKES